MKKLAFLLIAVMLLTLAACGAEDPTDAPQTVPSTTIGQIEVTQPATNAEPQPTGTVPATTVQPPVQTTVPPTEPTQGEEPVQPENNSTDMFYLDDSEGWIEFVGDSEARVVVSMLENRLDAAYLQELGLSGEEAYVSINYYYAGTYTMVETQGGDIYSLPVDGVSMKMTLEYSDVAALRAALLKDALEDGANESMQALIRGEDVEVEMSEYAFQFYFVLNDKKVSSLELASDGVRDSLYEFYENGMCKYEMSFYGSGSVRRCFEYDENGMSVSTYYYYENGMTRECYLYNEYGDWVYYEAADEDGNLEEVQTAEREYYADGILKSVAVYSNGKLSEAEEYYETGERKKVTEYHENGVASRVREYNAYGDITIRVEFDEDNVRIAYKRYEYNYSADGINLGWKAYGAMGEVLENRENYPDGTRKLEEVYNEDGTLAARCNYNPDGDILREEEYSDNFGPGPEWVWVYTYYANGNRESRNTYYQGVQYSSLLYYESGSKKQSEYYDDAGALESRHYYDENGNNIRTEWHNPDLGEGPYAAETNTYYDNGMCKHIVRYEFGSMVAEWDYYETGNLKCKVEYGDHEIMSGRAQYREDGSKISLEYFYSNGNPEYMVTYHANGAVFEEIYYYEAGGVKEYVQYDEYGGLIQHIQYNEDGSVAN